jgi:hypothetical protein
MNLMSGYGKFFPYDFERRTAGFAVEPPVRFGLIQFKSLELGVGLYTLGEIT